MLSQQIIVDMTEGYPFGSYHNQQLPDNKIFVRRIVEYNSSNYAMYKERFDIAKKISNLNVVRLVKVLEEEGRFHLLYEYVQFNVESQLHRLNLDHLENLKMKLVYLSAYLFENRLQTEFTIGNVGLDRKMELKYYLSVDFKTSTMKLAETQNGYISQINRIHRVFVAQLNSTDRKNKFMTEPQQRSIIYSPKVTSNSNTPFRRTDSITMKQQSLSVTHQNREKSVMSHKTIGKHQAKSPTSTINTNTIEMLNHIEMRLGELKITIKKSNTEQHKQMRESVKEKWSKHKSDNRKYSGEVSYFSPLPKKIQMVESPKSVRNPHKKSFKMGLENIVEASEQQNNRKQSTDTAKLQLQAKQQQQQQQFNVQLAQPGQRIVSAVTSTVQNYTEHSIKAAGTNAISVMAKKSTTLMSGQPSPPSPPSPKSFDTISRSSKIKEPKNKIDFQELKKNEFESFFQSQQKYIHEFLGILGDDSSAIRQKSQPTDIDKIQQSNKMHIQQDDILRSKSRNNNPHSYRDIHQEISPSKLSMQQKRHREFELKDRITQAIKQSNMALERYRKLSIHSISTDFNKSKKT